MQFHIHCKKLLTALKEVKLATNTKTHLPADQVVVIALQNDVATFNTGTADVMMQVELDIMSYTFNKEGFVQVNLKDLLDTLKAFDAKDMITLIKHDDEIEITAGDTTAKLSTVEFDILNNVTAVNIPGDFAADLSKQQVIRIIDRLAWAAASYDSTSILGGVSIHTVGNNLAACATDGSRLSSLSEDSINIKNNLTTIIPANIFKILTVLLKNKDRSARVVNLSIYQDDKYLTLSFAGTTLRFKTIDGEYPKYAELFPVKQTAMLEFNREQFTKLVKAAGQVADERTNLVKVLVNGKATVSSHTPDRAGFTGSMEYKALQTADPEFTGNFAVNSTYLLDVLEAAVGTMVTIQYNGPLKPLVFLDNENRTKHLLMPVQAK